MVSACAIKKFFRFLYLYSDRGVSYYGAFVFKNVLNNYRIKKTEKNILNNYC